MADWKSTKQAALSLGMSREHLLHLRKDGSLRVGLHWRDIRRISSFRATYQWNCEAIAKYLAVDPSMRK